MMFLEYVEQINANISIIDKNSTITVRGRNLKMLRSVCLNGTKLNGQKNIQLNILKMRYQYM